MKQVQSQWSKGVNNRVSDRRGDPERLSQLINARLQERGSTLEVSRINGFSQITAIGDADQDFYDAVMYDNNIVLFTRPDGQDPKILIINIDDGTTVADFDITGTTKDITYGKLVLLEDTVFVTPFNKQVNFIDGTWRLNDFISTTPLISSIQSVSGGNLDQSEDYWYKARYIYFDGHITKSSYPIKVETGTANKTVEFDVSVAEDLDGEFAQVEILRKKDAEDFFVIDRSQPQADPYAFTDDGLPNLIPYEEESYVWAKDSVTQDFVRDRIVKANNEYDTNEDSSEFGFDIPTGTEITDGEQGLPTYTDLELYNKIKKEDGTEGFFNLQNTISTQGSIDSKLSYKQISEYIGEFKENALYARFRPKESPDSISFNSLEIYNQNVPSIETANETEAEQDKPINPHVFLGWKYLFEKDNSVTVRVYDEGWDTSSNESSFDDDYFPVGQAGYPNTATLSLEDLIDVTIYDGDGDTNIGQSLPYTRKYYRDHTSSLSDSAIFQLAFYEGLQESIRQGKLKLKLTGVNEVNSLSTTAPISEFIDYEAKVVGLVDKSSNEQQVYYDNSNQTIYPSGNSRLYLVLENGTPFDEFNNDSANNSGVRADYDAVEVPNVEHRYEFELIGLTEYDGDTTTETVLDDWSEFDYDYRLRLTDYTDTQNQSGVYLKSLQTNEVESSFTSIDHLGWIKQSTNKFEFYTFDEFNILESVIVKNDLRQFENNYPNQLIWSQSFIPRSNASKVRNFDFENFKNISADYGDILDIEYIQNVLLVFCERGVNLVNVGEILTQQAGGEVFVDSSRFLTNDYWILKNVPNIQAKSIVQYENLLFFSDGRDVWKYEGGLQNITNGAIDIGGVASPSCVSCASIDPLNKEYRLGTTNGTWAYSIELGEWMGPHSYKDSTNTTYRDRMISVVDGKLVEHNSGNDFNGTSYNTVIAGVTNDADDPTITKLFRKFYVETQPTDASATFEYGKDENINESLALDQKPNKNNLYHVGVNGLNKNGRYLSWKITTGDDNFILSSVGLLFEPKKRR